MNRSARPPRAQRSRKQGARARAFAALSVDHVIGHGHTLDHAFDEVLIDELPEQERSQIKALAFGALRWHHRHQLIISELLERPLRARDKILESLLSVGLFELVEARQPGYAAVSAAVDASRQLKRDRAAGLINAALRRFSRESSELLSHALAHEEGRYVQPQWFIDRMRQDWPEHWQGALTASLEQPPMWLRVNARRTTPAEYRQRLVAEAGVDATTHDAFPDALRLAQPLPVSALPGFADGDVSVQDAAAQLAADLLSPAKDMRVLDACAAPGGKTLHLLERAGGQLDLVAVDIDASRNSLVEDNLGRVGYAAEVLTADVQDVRSWASERQFDRILVDAPCSATGVIRRHPDIKFLRRAADIRALSERQLSMLDALWPLLAPSGRLLYATCSTLRQENDAVVSRFLDAHPDAVEIDAVPAPASRCAVPFDGPGLQLLPGAADTDGFYYALMERRV
ncbi:MAG: 16S rRNA (cytosine(967)-C(5))-methyltransferase RsmB [Gammaproteobacteria bacterium]